MTERDTTIRLVDEPDLTMEALPLLSDGDAIELLRRARRIAVIGASSHPWRASNSVMRYLLDYGYECVPVTPKRSEVLGRPTYPTLEACLLYTSDAADDL